MTYKHDGITMWFNDNLPDVPRYDGPEETFYLDGRIVAKRQRYIDRDGKRFARVTPYIFGSGAKEKIGQTIRRLDAVKETYAAPHENDTPAQ